MSRRVTVLAFLMLSGAALIVGRPHAAQRPKPPGAEFKGDAFRFNKIRDGIYHAIGTGSISVGCNATVIVNDEDVLVVDSHATPAAAWALAEQLRTLTDKPIRYVVNTHFHWDHAHGNQIYGPDVEIIGHEFTRRMLASGESARGRSWDSSVGGIPGQIAQIEKRIEAAPTEEAKAPLREQLFIQQQYRDAQASVKPLPPTVTLRDSLTLFRGGREIRILFLGRGHTGGDVVVFLPNERIVVTGDLVGGAGPSYLGDAYATEWAATLDRVRALDFEWLLPGHGEAFQDKAKIEGFQAYLRDFWQQAKTLHDSGVAAEEAARRIDLRKHLATYPAAAALKDVGVLNHGVYRVYDLLDGKIQ
jgi:glyoxylase-like metal-dependent hydrolase (beta-lactamase superfamily II)